MKRAIFALLVLALGLASAKTYTITLHEPALVGGTELQPGDYKVTVQNDNKVLLSSGKNSVESAVKSEQSENKYDATSVRLARTEDGKHRIEEIRLGGTKTRLVLN
jgi:hypothetical protein